MTIVNSIGSAGACWVGGVYAASVGGGDDVAVFTHGSWVLVVVAWGRRVVKRVWWYGVSGVLEVRVDLGDAAHSVNVL